METPPSKRVSAEGDLIREVSRSSLPSAGGANAEQHLMQLADDPLLLRAFIQRGAGSGPASRSKPALSGELAIVLSGAAIASRPSDSKEIPARREYGSHEGDAGSSLFPFDFHATAEDRREALDHDLLSGEAGPPQSNAPTRTLAAAMVTSVLILLLALLIPS
jgi:hypothetical protein